MEVIIPGAGAKPRRSRTLRHKAGLYFFFIAACGEDAPPATLCDPDAPLQLPGPQGQALQASVRIRDRVDRSWDANQTPRSLNQGTIQADFVDLSAVTSTPAAFLLLGDQCVGRTSRPQSSAPTFLPMTSLSVAGTSRGTVSAMTAGVGKFALVGEPFLGADPLVISADTDGDRSFPAFTETVASLPALSLSAPALIDATMGLDDLPFRWEAASGDFVTLTLVPDQANVESGGQVICTIRDDGCFDLPAAATNFLLAADTESYTVIISRHRLTTNNLRADAYLELQSIQELRFTVQPELLP